jgi:predicted PP-loop superfamily ATPase
LRQNSAGGAGGHRGSDFVSDEEFERLLRAWFGNLTRVLHPTAPAARRFFRQRVARKNRATFLSNCLELAAKLVLSVLTG